MPKFLVIRFSSIGDIVLTTPVVRCLKQQIKGAEVHYLTKPQFKSILAENPYIDKIHTLQNSLNDTVKQLEKEQFNYIIDLHKNLRTLRVKNKLRIKSFSFNKLNLQKWLLVNFKINRMPNVHIVDRYLETVKHFGVTNDQQGLNYFIPHKYEVVPKDMHPALQGKFIAVILGATYATKQIPDSKIIAIANGVGMSICLIGGKDVEQKAQEITEKLKVPFLNTVGKINLHQSASFIKQSALVITPDTGMMHIAAAFKKDIISLWGNTVASLGMYPYLSGKNSKIFDIDLPCRPCSKIGFNKCPKKHFHCMNKIDNNLVIQQINKIIR